MRGFWSIEKEEKLLALKKEGKSWVEIARELGTTVDAVTSKYWRITRNLSRRERERKLQEEREKLLAASLRSEELLELRKLAKEQNLLLRLEELLKGIVPSFPPVPAPQFSRSDSGSVETNLLILSDWHGYEVVDRDRVRGLNEYNSRIFSERVYTVVHGALKIKSKLESSGWKFHKLVCALNGDFVSGTIHELERFTDSPNIVTAVYGTAYLLAQAIRDLAANYSEVVCYCVPGNHGRLPDSKTVPSKDPLRSWDTIVYLLAKEMLRDQPNVTFHIPNSYSIIYEIDGWNFLQTHGHQIKSWQSIPWYGIQRVVTTNNNLESLRGERIHYCLISHFHNKAAIEYVGVETFVNGSLIGLTEYALERGVGFSYPSQLFLSVHKEIGVSSRWVLRADLEPSGFYPYRPWEEL